MKQKLLIFMSALIICFSIFTGGTVYASDNTVSTLGTVQVSPMSMTQTVVDYQYKYVTIYPDGTSETDYSSVYTDIYYVHGYTVTKDTPRLIRNVTNDYDIVYLTYIIDYIYSTY